jgi:hypothetical protein
LVDATIADGKHPEEKLVVDVRGDMKAKSGQTQSTNTNQVEFLGEIGGADIANKMIDRIKTIELTKKPPLQNCVDFTKLAVDELSGMLKADAVAAFTKLFDDNAETVREKTACNFCPVKGDEDDVEVES